jgi:hypothetical protein
MKSQHLEAEFFPDFDSADYNASVALFGNLASKDPMVEVVVDFNKPMVIKD